MTTNKLKPNLRDGESAVGGWCALSDSLAAEIVAGLDVDYVVIDMQHGVAPYSNLVAMLQGIGTYDVTPLVRIPVGDFGLAQRALDAGAQGIIVPLVDNAGDAANAVSACRYPPEGNRSFGPIRARMHLGSDPESVNEQVLVLVQVETLGAMENLEEIVTTPGVDGVYVGPADLAMAHGLPVGKEDPQMEEMLTIIVRACHEAGVVAGIHTFSGTAALRASKRGFAMTTVGSDATWLHAGYSRELAMARGIDPPNIVGFY